jgi:hypothetical protein
MDAELLEPVGHSMKVAAEGTERPHRLRVTTWRDRHSMKIETSGIG